MAVQPTDIQFRLSGGAANSDPNASLGGAKSATAVSSAQNGFFDIVNSTEASAGDVEYRCFYVNNANATQALQNAKIFIAANTTGSRIAIGLGTTPTGTEQTVANENTAPSGVTFSQPADFATGLSMGSIGANNAHYAIWVRRTIGAATAASNDTFTLRVQGDTAA